MKEVEISIKDFQRRFPAILKELPVVITRRGERIAIVIDAKDVDREGELV